MASVKTESVSEKLEQIIDFRIGEGSSEMHPIVAKEGMTPATDGNSIFLPEAEGTFKSERDNELALANFTAHESDHIVEYEDYFGGEIGKFREGGDNAIQEYSQRNYSELTENPALAGWIDNIVKDHRIDSQRKKQLPGVNRFYKDSLIDAIKYLRPSTARMSDLDAFREQFLQQTLIGETVEAVPKQRRPLLEEVVVLAQSSDTIYQDPKVVKQIYQRFKENFDITQKIKRLPSKHNTGDHSRTQGSPQDGYQGQVQPREERNPDEKKPKQLSEKARDGKKLYEPDDDAKDKKGAGEDEEDKNQLLDERGKEELYKQDRNALYERISEDQGIDVVHVKPSDNPKIREATHKNRMNYTGEVESMRRIFRQLKLRHYGTKRDFEGAELDYEVFMQGELEARVTGVQRDRRLFVKETQNERRPAWAVLADVSRSTGQEHFNIIDQIRSALFIQGEALSVSGCPFGLFTFSDALYVLKDFTEQYTENTADKIMSAKPLNGTSLGHSLYAVGDLLRRQKEQPQGITIVTDGQANDMNYAREAITDLHKRKIHPFLVVIGKKLEDYGKNLTSRIGEEHYSVVEKDKLYELPNEMFRLFKTYGIAR